MSGHFVIKILENPAELSYVEDLQSLIWTGNERDIVPVHMLLAVVRNGGLLIGAFESPKSMKSSAFLHSTANQQENIAESGKLVGFVFGFPALTVAQNGQKLHHHSHMLGVHPDFRNRGIGFLLKRAQWQMIRRQGIEVITWTYDPLLSRNAYLNIARLGAITRAYRRDYYGEMHDDLNAGVASDRFVVEWWLNSRRVDLRLSKRPRRVLDLAHFLAGDVVIINPSRLQELQSVERTGSMEVYPVPPSSSGISDQFFSAAPPTITLVEVPSDFLALRTANPDLGRIWRSHTRALFEKLFDLGYLVTDFIYLPATSKNSETAESNPVESLYPTYTRSFYVLSYGESTL